MGNKASIAVIGILLLACGVLGYKLNQSLKTVDQQTVTIDEGEMERDRLELDLERMKLSYDTLNTVNDTLRAEMEAQKAQIENLLTRVKDRNWSIGKLKKEAETLRNIMKGYVVTIDSLNTLNSELIAANEQLTSRITNVEGENISLKERQSTMETIISEGQLLRTASMAAQGIRLRSGGKQVDTERASRTEMVKTCFTINENRIAKPGDRSLFMQIIKPDGSVLPATESNASSTLGDSVQAYSVKRTIDYNNAQMDVCIFYTVQGEMEKGDYKVLVYEESQQIGSTDFSLK